MTAIHSITGLQITKSFMVNLVNVLNISTEEEGVIALCFPDHLVEIYSCDEDKPHVGFTYYVPVNEFHRIKREIEQFFSVEL
ncbi:hypothetical protein [Photobacterium lucens]|uniref:hypothetical protein n=1 Tax=Photobacterium lucens TaxID=2562949 RepID=UPI001367A55F|nr:hypothetical protein [Photobacterium lucens]MBP2701010.1 hypothetical protein [Vibrio parahaemolyticus]MZG58691.1 hypothetical protein [Photobacterium lucens]MZG79352.1 hypothetical protein [Photobacterium lucens]